MRIRWPSCAEPKGDTYRGLSGRLYSGKVFGLLGVEHPVRARAIRIVEHKLFDTTVLLLILLNCVTMALKDPLAAEPPDWSLPIEWAFTLLFSTEMLSKVLAMGLLPVESKLSYLTGPGKV